MAKTKALKEVVEEAKTEVKSWLNKDTMEKIIKTINYIPVPVAALGLIWGFDVSLYVTAFCGILVSICEFVKLFLKD